MSAPKPLKELLSPSRYNYLNGRGENHGAGYTTSASYEMARRLRALDARHQATRRRVAEYTSGEITLLHECSCSYDGETPCPDRILLDGGKL